MHETTSVAHQADNQEELQSQLEQSVPLTHVIVALSLGARVVSLSLVNEGEDAVVSLD